MRTLFKKTLSKTPARHVLFTDQSDWSAAVQKHGMRLEEPKDQPMQFFIARSATGSGKVRGGFFPAASFGWMAQPRALPQGE